MPGRLVGTVIAILLVSGAALPAVAQNKCDAGKLKCVRSKFGCLVKVHEVAQKKALPPDPVKLQKCTDKFEGGVEPAKGCFAKLEANPDATCSTTGNVAGIETLVDEDVQAALSALDVASPPPAPNPCDAGKLKCVRVKFACLVKVYETAQKKGLPPDPVKLLKCMSKFDGGPEPAKGCFAKLEAQPAAACSTTGNTATMEAQVDQDVEELLAALGITIPTTTSVPTTSTTVLPGSSTSTTAPPVTCFSSEYPACGGSCGASGLACWPLDREDSFGQDVDEECICASATAPCSCSGGAACPSGQICNWIVDPINPWFCVAAFCVGPGATTTTTTLPGCGVCEPPLTCLSNGGSGFFCGLPCGGAFPACGGSCPSGYDCDGVPFFPAPPTGPEGVCLCLVP